MNINNYNHEKFLNNYEAIDLIDSFVNYYLTQNKNFDTSNHKSLDSIIKKLVLFDKNLIEYSNYSFLLNRTLLQGFNIVLHLSHNTYTKTFTRPQLQKIHNQILKNSSVQFLLF